MKTETLLILAAIGVIVVLLLRNKPVSAISSHNAETWEWLDWKGQPRKAIVHRQLEITP